MSAGSPRRSNSQTRQIQTSVTVSPQQVTDPTILDSVAGFINEVATYNVPCDTKDQIQWARFEQLDSDVVLENAEGEKVVPLSLILILGYTTGIQVWAIPANGEGVEILSWRHGSVRVLRFLPAPAIVGKTLVDTYSEKRPLIALCDSSGSQFCTLNFISLKTGEQQKIIKFKTPILDVLANRRSVVVTFLERIAVFDAFTLEDRLTVTTCYLSPGVHPNPIALGTRWIAYAEKRLIGNKRSGGGNEGEGIQSYTATVLHAAKSLGKGLRELGETVASSLTGKPGTSPGGTHHMQGLAIDGIQKGIVTILDIENQVLEDKTLQVEGVVAHFAAHSDAIVCLAFDPSGMLLLTADKRGHDFHLFRIHPHPGGPALAAVHHLYILHRGDTTARVQDICFSPDSRWAAVSTLRGTTHVFPITPYGGNVGMRTHATPHVVNRMSRFHRSAGLPVEGRCNSPVSLFEAPIISSLPYNNPRMPPYPHPTPVHPLAQIRQPLFVQPGPTQSRPPGRQRLNSGSEDNSQVALKVCACFAPPRAWFDTAIQSHDPNLSKQQARAVESLFVMSCYGNLVQYDLEPHHVSSVTKEKVCDETPVELGVTARAQWSLQRKPQSVDVTLPMPEKILCLLPHGLPLFRDKKKKDSDDRWLSQVEIVTHAGPHRRLWMGPQFTFKTYTVGNGLNEVQAVDVGKTKPVNMPISTAYPILIESSSVSSCEQSPKLMEGFHRFSTEVNTAGPGEMQLKEDLADAMLESPGVRETGGRCVIVSLRPTIAGGVAKVAKVVNPLGTVVTVPSDDDPDPELPEEVIHENCDEALFRPIVTPKPARKFPTDIVTESTKKKPEPVAVQPKRESKPPPPPPPAVDVKPPEEPEEITLKLKPSDTKIESEEITIKLKSKNVEPPEEVKIKPKNKNGKQTRNKFESKYEIKLNSKIDDASDIEIVSEPLEKAVIDPPLKSKKSSVKIELETKSKSKKIDDSLEIITVPEVPPPETIEPEPEPELIHKLELAKDPENYEIDMINFEDAENFWLLEPELENATETIISDENETIEEWEVREIYSQVRAACVRLKRNPNFENMCKIMKTIKEKRNSKVAYKEIRSLITSMIQQCKSETNAVNEKELLDLFTKSKSEPALELKPRKLKTQKLGSKVNWGKEEKELYWKSVFPTDVDDTSKEDMAPKMSYSSAAKRHLLQDEQIFAESSSDDNSPINEIPEDKQDNSSSPIETTESDEDKGIAMDTEEDGCQKQKTVDTNLSKSKKKPKKKKR